MVMIANEKALEEFRDYIWYFRPDRLCHKIEGDCF
jgi:hypothetical protein